MLSDQFNLDRQRTWPFLILSLQKQGGTFLLILSNNNNNGNNKKKSNTGQFSVYSNSVHSDGLHSWLRKNSLPAMVVLCFTGRDETKVLIPDKQIATDSLTGHCLQVNRIEKKNTSIDLTNIFKTGNEIANIPGMFFTINSVFTTRCQIFGQMSESTIRRRVTGHFQILK